MPKALKYQRFAEARRGLRHPGRGPPAPFLPAADASFVFGDLTASIDGRPTTGLDDLLRALDRDAIGRTLELGVVRAGRRLAIRVIPRERRRG